MLIDLGSARHLIPQIVPTLEENPFRCYLSRPRPRRKRRRIGGSKVVIQLACLVHAAPLNRGTGRPQKCNLQKGMQFTRRKNKLTWRDRQFSFAYGGAVHAVLLEIHLSEEVIRYKVGGTREIPGVIILEGFPSDIVSDLNR
jgi:hypothetical protein